MEFFPRIVLVGCIGGVGAFLLITGVEVCAGLEKERLELNLPTLQRFFEPHLLLLWVRESSIVSNLADTVPLPDYSSYLGSGPPRYHIHALQSSPRIPNLLCLDPCGLLHCRCGRAYPARIAEAKRLDFQDRRSQHSLVRVLHSLW